MPNLSILMPLISSNKDKKGFRGFGMIVPPSFNFKDDTLEKITSTQIQPETLENQSTEDEYEEDTTSDDTLAFETSNLPNKPKKDCREILTADRKLDEKRKRIEFEVDTIKIEIKPNQSLAENNRFKKNITLQHTKEVIKSSTQFPIHYCLKYDESKAKYVIDKRKSYAYKVATDLCNFELQQVKHKILGLPEYLWNGVFSYLNIDDMKSLRLASRETNYLVEHTLRYATDLCFVHDENIHPRIQDNPTIPSQLICQDGNLGWPGIRLRHFKTPFSGKKYFSENNKKLDKLSIQNTIKTVDIQDCCLAWTDIMEIVGCLQNLTNFGYTHTPEFLQQNNNKVFKVMKGNLKTHFEIVGVLKKSEYKRYRFYKGTPSKLSKVIIKALNLGLTNFLLATLDQICRKLEAIEIYFQEDLFMLNDTTESSMFDGRRLICNNQETLRFLNITFLDELYLRKMGPGNDGEPNLAIQTKTPMFCNAFFPLHERLKLNQLTLQIPLTFVIYETQSLTQKKRWASPKPISEICSSKMKTFLASQSKSLEFLKIGRVMNSNSEGIRQSLLQLILKLPIMKISAWYDANDDFDDKQKDENAIINWNEIKPVLQDVVIYLNDNSVAIQKVFPKDMPVMKHVKILQVDMRTTEALPTFNIESIVQKFPNLTRLALVDSKLCESYSHRTYKNSTKVTDLDLQTIIYFFPLLTELILQCNMNRVTDFGLTGISPWAISRMQKSNQYILQSSDKIGNSISSLKDLQVLELHGLGNRVTGVSANLAFENTRVRELYLFSPKFTKRQKKELKEKFSFRENHKVIIK